MDELNRPDLEQYKTFDKIPVVVVLDNIRSGLNVGAIFRTADAFTIKAIYLCGITVQPPHAEILKTSLGASASVEWRYFPTTLAALEELKGGGYALLPVEQTDKAIPLDKVILPDFFPLALIFGNEMRGISPEVLSVCDTSLEIP